MAIKIMAAITIIIGTIQLYYNITNWPKVLSFSLPSRKMKLLIMLNVAFSIALLATVIVALVTQ